MDKSTQTRTLAGLIGLSLSLMATTSGLAIGIGDIQVKSALNQPLYASIPITSGTDEILSGENIQVRLASPEMHAQAGLRYPAELAGTHFDLYQTADGQTQVLMGTRDPIREPLVNFLLEVEWSHGKLLKEVSVLLDPPGYQRLPDATPLPSIADSSAPATQAQPTAPQPVALASTTPSRPTVTDIGSIDVPVFVEVPASLKTSATHSLTRLQQAPIRKKRTYKITNGQYGPVRSGDTLMEIARAAVRGTGQSAKAMARRIYETNPEAFLGSMNNLEKGAILYIPEETYSHGVSGNHSIQVAQADTAPISGISTISDFAFELPPEEIVVETPAAAPPTTTPTETQPATSSKSLEILPADKTSSRIAQDIAKKLEENQQQKTSTSEAVTLEKAEEPTLLAPNSSLKSAIGKPAEPAQEPSPTAAPRDEFQQTETSKDKGTAAAEDTSHNEQPEPLRAAVETDELPGSRTTETTGFDKLLKWLPWLLILLTLPIMLLLGLRRKEEPPVKIPAREPQGFDPNMPKHRGDTHRDEFRPASVPGTPDKTSEFTQDTAVFEHGGKAAAPGSTTELPRPRSPGGHSDLPHQDDLAPTASDTQETIQPYSDGPSTQILEMPESFGEEAEAELDAAQEAEIYLAYGQYSLAEVAINKLREQSQDNDRFKLLQLKLFAETGKLEEMQVLADELLQNSQADSGLAQQIHKIIDRAHERHGQPQTGNSIPQAEAETPADDLDTVALNKPETQQIDPATDPSASNAALYTEDIRDYLHEKIEPEPPKSAPNEDPLRDSLGSLTSGGDTETDTGMPEIVEEEAFTDAELDAISMELDLMDDPGDSLEIGDELDQSYADEAVENFSDTDYRLSPLGRENKHDDKSERLDVPFDLESELEKLSRTDTTPKSS